MDGARCSRSQFARHPGCDADADSQAWSGVHSRMGSAAVGLGAGSRPIRCCRLQELLLLDHRDRQTCEGGSKVHGDRDHRSCGAGCGRRARRSD